MVLGRRIGIMYMYIEIASHASNGVIALPAVRIVQQSLTNRFFVACIYD